MASKRNAALEALLGAGYAPAPETPPAAPAEEGSATVVAMHPIRTRKGVAKVMVYMPAKVARKFREIAFTEERKANDVYLEALDLFLTKQGHGGIKGVVER
jgi:hypothetical protein